MSVPVSKISVRRGTPDDIEVLARVGSESFRGAYGPHANAADLESHIEVSFSPDAIRDTFAAGQSVYYLAFVEDQPAGLAKVRMADCPLVEGSSNAVELQQLYVLTGMRRHGLGRQLVGRVFEHAEASAAAGVWLSAWEFADWATRFYAGVGFEPIGKVEFKLGATAYTDVLMWRPLP